MDLLLSRHAWVDGQWTTGKERGTGDRISVVKLWEQQLRNECVRGDKEASLAPQSTTQRMVNYCINLTLKEKEMFAWPHKCC